MLMLTRFVLLLVISLSVQTAIAEETSGLRGDPAAIADAQAMVEAMGGLAWCAMKWSR